MAVFKVGSFLKSTGTAPVSQTVAHGLGQTPKALILWTNGKTDELFSGSFMFGQGFSDGVNSRSVAVASLDNDLYGNYGGAISSTAVLTIVNPGDVVVARCSLASWDATNFVLNWTTNDAVAYVIHFIAIGGTDVSAKVITHNTPTVTGNISVTGVGFQPDVILTLPATTGADKLSFGLGAASSSTAQWATRVYAISGASNTRSKRAQLTNACVFEGTDLFTRLQASLVSFDADGFTLNYTAVATVSLSVWCLCLKGVFAKAGVFNKSTGTAPASQAITGVGFKTRAVLLASFQNITAAGIVANARFGIGASDGTTEGCSAFQDTDVLATSSADGIDKTSKVFVKVNNNTPSIDAEADLTSLDADGFTLSWTTNDAVATEMLYLAFGGYVDGWGTAAGVGSASGGAVKTSVGSGSAAGVGSASGGAVKTSVGSGSAAGVGSASGAGYRRTGYAVQIEKATQNIVKDASFDSATAINDAASPWKYNATPGVGESIAKDATVKRSGGSSVKIIAAGTEGIGVNQQLTGWTAGDYVSISGYINVSAYTAGTIHLDLLAKDAGGVVVLDTSGIQLTATTQGFVRFEEISVQIPSTAATLWVRAFATDTPNCTFYVDDVQDEKDYGVTSFIGAADDTTQAQRAAESLNYLLDNVLPNKWGGYVIWRPDRAHNYPTNSYVTLAQVTTTAGAERYKIAWRSAWTPPGGAPVYKGDTFRFVKNDGTTSYTLYSSLKSFNAGDTVFVAWLDDQAAGVMKLWVSINGGNAEEFTLANSVAITDAKKVWVGCESSAGYECNGAIDVIHLYDAVVAAAESVTLNLSFFNSICTNAVSPGWEVYSILFNTFAAFSIALPSSRKGAWIMPAVDVGMTPDGASIAITSNIPVGNSITGEYSSSNDGVNYGAWTVIPAGGGLPLARYIKFKFKLSGTDLVNLYVDKYTYTYSIEFSAPISIYTGLPTGTRVRFVTYQNKVYVAFGGRPLVYDGTTIRQAGVDPPATAPALAVGAAGGLTGTYYGKVTFVNTDGVESNPSVASGAVTVSAQQINWTIPTGPAGTAKRKLYRTKAGGSVYYYITEIADNTTTAYADNTADGSLTDAMKDYYNVPPNADIVFEFMNYMFYVSNASKNQLWYSLVGDPEHVPNISGKRFYKQFSGNITGIAAFNNALVIMGEDFVAPITTGSGFIFDSDPTLDTTIIKYIDKGGALAHEAIALCTDPELRQIMVFPTRTGVRFLLPGLQEQSLEAVPLSRNVQPYFDSTVLRSQMAAVFYNSRFMIAFSYMESGLTPPSANNIIFLYDHRSKQWIGPWTIPAACFAVANNKLYCGSPTEGKVYRMLTGTNDDGANIKMILDLPYLMPAGDQGKCRFQRFRLRVSNDSVTTSLQVKPKVDDREATVNIGTIAAGFSGERRPGDNTKPSRKFPIPLPPGITLGYRVVDDSTNPVSLRSITTEFEDLGVKA
ncbi:MAG: hypothetical protein AB1510_02120 [Bacillota bacterium]